MRQPLALGEEIFSYTVGREWEVSVKRMMCWKGRNQNYDRLFTGLKVRRLDRRPMHSRERSALTHAVSISTSPLPSYEVGP